MKGNGAPSETSASSGVLTYGACSSEKLSVNEILPEFAGSSETARLRRAGYNVYRDAEMGRLIYTYNVSWTEKSDKSHKAWKRIVRSILKSRAVVLKVPLRCDCPCGTLTDDYVQFGLCDHIICRKCNDTAERADHDGLRGCCNTECLKLARYANKIEKKNARKEEHTRAKRLRSKSSYHMEYDDKDFNQQLEEIWRARNLADNSAESESIMPTSTSIPSQS